MYPRLVFTLSDFTAPASKAGGLHTHTLHHHGNVMASFGFTPKEGKWAPGEMAQQVQVSTPSSHKVT